MRDTRYDVVGIGNAIVDIIGRCDDAFLSKHDAAQGLHAPGRCARGGARSTALHGSRRSSARADRPPTRSPGSPRSAARAPSSAASPTTSSAGLLARHPRHRRRLRHARRRRAALPTALCLILVTPDGERTMNTFLGASTELGPQRGRCRADRLGARSPISRATCSTSRRRRRRSAPPPPSPPRPAARPRSRCRTPSASIATATDFRKLVQSRHRHPVRQREGDHRALRGELASMTPLTAVRGECEIAVLTRSDLGSLIVTAQETIRSARRRSTRSSTRPAPATSMRRGFSTASRAT